MGSLSYRDSGVDIDAGEEAVPQDQAPRRVDLATRGDRRHRRIRCAVRARPRQATRSRCSSRPPTASARRRWSRRRPAGSTRSASISSRCASTTSRARGPSRSGSSTTSRSATSIPTQVERLVAGVAEGCRQAGCALIGGEMAEHPGAMHKGEFDLVGFAVGVVERAQLVAPDRVARGRRADRPSLSRPPVERLLTRAASAARRRCSCLSTTPRGRAPTTRWPTSCCCPSVIYAPAVRAVADHSDLHGVAHITGGGLVGNVPRMLPARPRRGDAPFELGGAAHLRRDRAARSVWSRRRWSGCSTSASGWSSPSAVKTPRARASVLRAAGHDAAVVGEVVPGSGQLTLVPLTPRAIDRGADRVDRDLDVALGRLPVRDRDPHAGLALPRRRGHHARAAGADRLEDTRRGPGNRTTIWLITTSFAISTPGISRSASANWRARAQHRSTSSATPTRPRLWSAAHTANARAAA